MILTGLRVTEFFSEQLALFFLSYEQMFIIHVIVSSTGRVSVYFRLRTTSLGFWGTHTDGRTLQAYSAFGNSLGLGACSPLLL